ncbi:MAG: ComF family protein [Bacteroidaceae bacterium]|nr:ComF family protein [Bacteroidaceae bacterium]
MSFARLYHSTIDLLFPLTCGGCGCRLALDEDQVCAECLLKLPLEINRSWQHNRRIAEWSDHDGVVGVGAFTRYTHDAISAHIIHSLKYYRRTALGQWMGRLAAQQLRASGLFDGVDAIVPLPLAPRRHRRRGFNQSVLIAQGMAAELGLPVLTGLLRRTGGFESQTRFTYHQRLENMKGAFALADGVDPIAMSGRHFLLVDDVITTGATMLSAITALEQIPAARFTAFGWAWVNTA